MCATALKVSARRIAGCLFYAGVFSAANSNSLAFESGAGAHHSDQLTSTNIVACESITSAAADAANLLPLLGDVDIYQKNGVVEYYNMRLDQQRIGPVSLRNTILQPFGRESWFIWSPDSVAPVDAEFILVELGEHLHQGTISFGIQDSTDQFSQWKMRLGPDKATPDRDISAHDDFRARVVSTAGSELRRAQGGDKLVGEIPARLKSALSRGDIKRVFVIVQNGGTGQAIAIKRLALSKYVRETEAGTAKLEGRVCVDSGGYPSHVNLLVADGSTQVAPVTEDGRFRFDQVKTGLPISLRGRWRGQDYYAGRGRWFTVYDKMSRVSIRIQPEYSNPEKTPIDPETVRLPFPEKPRPFLSYKETSLIHWNGSPGVQEFYRILEPQREVKGTPIQEFEGRTFSNDVGLIDRERYEYNRDGCFRIAHVGGSSSVALQVKLFQKFSTLLEQELGLALQRCVEVISAGRDNGDLGSVYPYIRDYLSGFNPSILIVEQMQLLALQLQPELLRRIHGWSHEISPLDHFEQLRNGNVRFVPRDDSWPLSIVEPDRSPLVPGLPLLLTVSMPWYEMPPEGRDAHVRAANIMRYYRREFASTRVFLQTGSDQARCRISNTCGPEFTLPDDQVIASGVSHFVDNVTRSCEIAGIRCLHPEVPGNDHRFPLTYADDGHYNVRGHQWLAKQLAKLLKPVIDEVLNAPGT